MAQQYWVKQQADGDEHGPYLADDLHQFVRAGIVAPDTLISLDRAAWYYADQIENLIPAATEPAIAHADTNAAPGDLQPSAEAEVPAPASGAVPIDYFNSSSPHAVRLRRPLTPERRFQGAFTYLHICAIALGLIIFAIGANIASSVLKDYDSRGLDIPMETIGWLTGFVLTAVLLIAAGGLGFIQGPAERLLFVAAVAFVVVRVMNGFMGLMVHNHGEIIGEGGWWPVIVQAEPVVFSLIVPALCVAGVAGWRRAKKSPAASDARSPWVALDRATAAVAILGGGILIARFGRTVIEDRQYANYQSPPPAPTPTFRTPAQLQQYQWRMSQRAVPIGQRKKAAWRIAAIALAMSLCIWVGGMIAWFSRWIGQTLLLLGAIGMTLFLLSAVGSLTRKAPAAQLTAVLEEAGSLIIFLLFGTFALIRGGIANTRTRVLVDGDHRNG